jgi:putative salt-induced outer membrane protein YdiY
LFSSFALADTVTMKNGDKVSGDVVKKDGANLTLKSKYFGTITLPWAEIDSIKTETPVTVALPGGDSVKANIESQGGQIRVAAPSPRSVAPADVVTLRNDAEQRNYERFLRPGILDLWTVGGSFGLAGAKGNARTSTLTTPVNATRISNTSKTLLYFNSIRSSASVNGVQSQTAQAVRGGLSYSRNLTPKIFAQAFNDWEYDKFQNLDLRTVVGGGVGYHAWKRENKSLDVLAGFDWDRDKFGAITQTVGGNQVVVSPSTTKTSGEFFWGDDFRYKLNTRTNLTQTYRMFNNMSDTGAYRVNGDIALTTSITKWLNWSVGLSDRYLSTPSAGRMKNDFLYSTSLGFSWAR